MWTVKDGLPVNTVNGLIQDRHGYIWAATFDGLVRFNGIRFTVFISANSEELPSNRIVQLKEGPMGRSGSAPRRGMSSVFRDGRFTNIPFVDETPDERFSNLLVDGAGNVWFGTRRGLWRVEHDRLVQIGRPTYVRECLRDCVNVRVLNAASVAVALTLEARTAPQLLIVDAPQSDVLVALPRVRALVIVDDEPRRKQFAGARVRFLARPFTAARLVAEVGLVRGDPNNHSAP